MSSRTTFHTFPILAVTLQSTIQKTHFSRFSRPTTRTHLPTILYPRKLSSHCIFLFIILLVNTRSSIVIYSFTVFRADGYRWYRYHWSIGRTIETRHFFWWNAMERIIVSREISTKIFKSLKLTKLTRFYSSWRSSNIREQLHLYVFIYIYGYIPFEKKIYVYMCV